MFFLRGVSVTARAPSQTAKDIVALRDSHRVREQEREIPCLLDAL
jgi:hypothetical protein